MGGVADGYGCNTVQYFGVKGKENQDKVPTLNWLPKLHKTYRARFDTNSSSCTTTELSKLLTSCLTAFKNILLSSSKSKRRILQESILVH